MTAKMMKSMKSIDYVSARPAINPFDPSLAIPGVLLLRPEGWGWNHNRHRHHHRRRKVLWVDFQMSITSFHGLAIIRFVHKSSPIIIAPQLQFSSTCYSASSTIIVWLLVSCWPNNVPDPLSQSASIACFMIIIGRCCSSIRCTLQRN